MEGDHQGEPAKKPRHLTAHNAAAFRLESVAKYYPLRPPYPAALVERLKCDGTVLEMGCGTAEIARRLAPFARRVVAVDPSGPMLARAQALPGGDAPNIEWHESTAEGFDYPDRYDLIVTPQSLHWMDWPTVLRAFGRALAGKLAIIPTSGIRSPWRDRVRAVVPEFSTMKDFEDYDLIERVAPWFELEERVEIGPEPFRQTIADYIGSWWSRAGFARLEPEEQLQFAARLERILEPYAKDGWIESEIYADFAIGTIRS